MRPRDEAQLSAADEVYLAKTCEASGVPVHVADAEQRAELAATLRGTRSVET